MTKVRVAPSKWDAENLHRHPDYAPVKKEAAVEPSASKAVAANPPVRLPSAPSNTSEFEDEFGGNLFDEVDFSHPDEVRLDYSITDVSSVETPIRPPTNALAAQAATNRQQPNRVASMPNVRQPSGGPQQNGQQARPSAPAQTFKNPNPMNNQPSGRMMPPPQQANNNQNGFRSNPSSASDSTNSRQITPPEEQVVTPSQIPPHVPSGFVSGRAATAIVQPPEAGAAPPIKPFDPYHESPSIRRTSGVDLRKSAPIKRSEVGAPTIAPSRVNGAAPANKSNFVNPAMDASRRIGMPGGMQSPLANRSAYKPPTKRPLPADASTGRPPLADMSNVQTDGAADPKKMKMEAAQDAQPSSAERTNGALA